jgi:hypothetical protein
MRTDAGSGAGGDARDRATSPTASGTVNRSRFVTYVSSGVESDPDSRDPDRSEHALEIGRLAVKRVVDFERRQRRVPEEMPHSNPGYDVVSTEPDGATRYIEIKGIDGPWGEAGVAVSKRQFAFAAAKADEAWLYVVEHVRDDANAHIFTINDPAGQVTHFFFDAGWRGVTSDVPPSLHSEPINDPPGAGDRIVLLDGEVVEVSRVEKHGLISRLTVRSAGGEMQTVVWRPGMTIESRGEV